MRTIEYDISTGSKSEYYTLWATTTIDLRPRNDNGEIISNFKLNAVGGNMYYHVHINFIQNLGKTKESSMKKLDEMGISINESAFDFDLKHYSKPSFEAFGVKMKFKKDKWYALATKEFFEIWKINKDHMKKLGWGCWKYKNDWYMAINLDNKS